MSGARVPFKKIVAQKELFARAFHYVTLHLVMN
jgi:hypothetical protein